MRHPGFAGLLELRDADGAVLACLIFDWRAPLGEQLVRERLSAEAQALGLHVACCREGVVASLAGASAG